MGRNLFRTLVANGFLRTPEKDSAVPKPAPRRRMLLERLEDRLLFDAGPVAPVDADAEMAQAAAAQSAAPADSSIAEPADVRLIESIDNVLELIADLSNSATNRVQELAPGTNSSGAATVDGSSTAAIDSENGSDSHAATLLNSNELTTQLLTTSDEQRSELQAAAADVRRELVFVDSSIEDYATLLADVDPRAEVVLLDANRDGIEQIAEVLAQRGGVDAIHIVSHGGSGELRVGQAVLNLDSMHGQYAEQLGRIGQLLAADADILIYGCNFAEGLAGLAAAETLALFTGADVAASNDATGNLALGGDWDLERGVGIIESNIAFGLQAQGDWQHLLAVLDWDTVDWVNEDLSGSFTVSGGTISLSITGDTDDLEPNSPDDDTTNTGGLSPVEESLLLYVDYESQTVIGDEMVTTTIDFTHLGGVSNVSFKIFDIDLDTWTDRIVVTANNGATINPSSVTHGSTNSFDGVNTVTGLSSNSSSSANGNATFTFNQTGITQVTILYQSGRLTDPGSQYISLHDITFDADRPDLDLDASSPTTFAGDNFSSGYNSNSGTIPWAGAWTENDPSDGAQSTAAGDVQIVSGELRISDTASGTGVSISRGINLSSYASNSLMTYSFDYRTGSGVDNSDAIVAEISTNGGTSYTTLETFTGISGATSGSRSFSITNGVSASDVIRFRVTSGYTGSNEFFFVDNVAITAQPSGYSTTFTEDAGAVAISDTDTTITDSDSTNMSRAVITLTNPQTSDALSVSGALPAGISLDAASTSTNIILTGTATKAAYETAIEQIRFNNSSQAPNTTTRAVTVVVTDDLGGASNTATTLITVVAVNDAPTGGNRTVTTAEDTEFTFTTADFPFSDVDGDALARVRIDTLPADGTVLLSGVAVTAGQIITVANITAGNLTFRPDSNENGSPYTTFTFSVGDASSFVASASTMTVNVTPVNDAPTSGNRTVTTAEDTDFTFTTADFPFSDVDGDSLTRIRIDTLPTDGTVLLSGVAVTAGQIITVANITAGNLKFRPDTNENGSPYTTFTFSVGDASSFVASASTMTVNVTPVNDAPTGGNRTVTTAEDTDFTFTTADFPFSDVDGDALARVRIDTLPTDGTVLLSGVAVTAGQIITAANITAGNLKFRPDANENGSPYTTFTFSVGDASLFVASPSTMTVNVTPVNDAPTGGNQTVTTAEDTDFTFMTSDFPFSDVDGGTIARVRIDTLPIDGSVLLSGVAVTAGQIISAANITAGNLKFRPDTNENGSPYTTFTFSVGDASTFVASPSTMTVNVTPVNDAPTGGNRTVTTTEDADFTFTTADFPFSDVDGDSLTRVRIDTLPTDGTVLLSGVAVTAGQVITVANITAGNLRFRPDTNETGSPYTTFEYSVGDGLLFSAASNTMTVNVTPVNDPPVADDDPFVVPEDGSVIIDVLDGDTDLDGDTLTVTEIDGTPISLGSPVTIATGVVSLNADGTLTFTPNANYNGPASFDYTVSDGALTDIGNVSGDVTPVNDPPIADDETFVVDEVGSVIIDVLDGDTDLDGDTLTVTEINGSPISLGSPVTIATGVVSLNADGTLTFIPNTDYNGPASFGYTVSDGVLTDVGNVSGDVTPQNDPPVADDETFVVPEDGSVVIDVLNGDTDLDGDTLTVTEIDGTPISLGSPVTIATGVVSLNADGTLTFTPNTDYNGPASFDYTVSDGNGGTDIGNVSGDVTLQKNPPVADDETFVVPEDGSIVIDVLDGDTDLDGDSLFVTEIDGTPISLGSPVTIATGVVSLNADGTLTFTPNADYNGPASFDYTVSDGNGGTDTGNVSGDVTPQNDPPVADDETFVVPEDGSIIIDVLDGDTDLDGDLLSVTEIDGSPISLGSPVTIATGVVSLNADGTLTFTPNADYNGPASFDYTVSDGTLTDVGNVSGDVTPVNDPPVADDETFTVAEDGSVIIEVLDGDTDLDGDSMFVTEIDGTPISLGNPVTIATGVVSLNADGTLTFTPNADYTGPASFDYTVSDGALTDVGNVSGDVTPENDPPVADDETFTVPEDGSVIIDVLDGDTDLDGDTLFVTEIDGTPISLGSPVTIATGVVSLNVDGTLTFTPNADYTGPASFDYTVSDGALTDIGNVSGDVTPVDDAPVGGDNSVTTPEDTDFVFSKIDFPFSDVEGELLTQVRIDLLPSDGTLLLYGTPVTANDVVDLADIVVGGLTFRPDADENGSPYTTFEFTVGNASAFVASPSTMTVHVTPTSVSVVKSLFDSSDPSTVGSNVTIGEEVCFALLVTMSEGNSTDLILTDFLPDGLAYDSFSLITDAASSNGLLAADFNGSVPAPSVSGGAIDGDDVSFTFGAISVAADADVANNSFVLLVHAFVSDIPSNHDPLAGTPTLTNTASADVSNPQPPTPSNPFDVTVVEPDLSVMIDNGVATLIAGQITTYSITITNDGDLLATGVSLSGSLPVDRIAFVSSDDAANFSIDGSGTFTWTPAIASLAPGASITLQLTAQVGSMLASGVTDVTIPVSVTHNNIEPTPANNSAEDTDTLDAAPDLQVTKTDFTNSISPGQGSVYTINISNIGTQAATNVLVTETVPVGTMFNAALSDPLWTLIAPDTYQISLPTLAAGAGFNVNFTVSINMPAVAGQDDIVNTVTISDDGTNGPDLDPTNDSATDTNTLDAFPDYQITIDDGELVVVPGQPLSYTINFTNVGLQNGTGLVVTDTFPISVLENVVASDGGIVDAIAGTITWNVGNLAVGDSRSFTVTANVRASIPAGVDDFTHDTTITDDLSNGADLNPGNNAGSDTDTLDATPDYRIAITDGETAVAPGQALSYSISFLNAGNQDGTGVVVSDTFPPEILENVVASDGGIVDAIAGTITWNVGNLAAGESRSFTVTANVRATIPAGFDDFTHATTIADDSANGTDSTPADNLSSDTDTLDAQPDYQISINDGVLSATTGQSLTYSVTFANAGFQDGTGVTVATSFPLSVLTNVVASNGGVVDMTSGTIAWNVGNLAAGASLTYTVTADVLSSVAAGIDDFTHSTTITDDGTNGADPTPANNSASDIDTLDAAPDLRITKTDFTNSISPGQGTVYTLNVGNFGTQGATNVVVTETLPAGTSFNPAFSDPSWTHVGGSVYQYSIISLTAGASFNVNFSVLINNPAVAGQDQIINTATITDDDTNGPDLDPANDSATDTNTLDALPMYDIGIDDLQATATPGETLTYYVNFNNYGLQNGTGVIVTASFPTALLTNVTASNGGIVDAVAGTITWNVGALTANDPRTFIVTAEVRSTVPSGLNDLTLSAVITDDGTNGPDPDLNDNSATDTDRLDAAPDYAITIDDGELVVRPGDPLTYTIHVVNSGNQDGNGVVVTVSFPVMVLQNVIASNGGVVDGIAGTITWNLGDLTAGGATTLTVSTQVRSNVSTQTSSIILTAAVSDDGLNGPIPPQQNTEASDTDRLQVYAYDSFHDWKDLRVAWLMPQIQTVGRPLAPLPVDPVFSGLTEPGSTLTARIYGADGRMLGDRQIVADSAGNWLVSFPNIIIYEYPHRMEIIVTPAINNLAHENGFNLRRYFHPAIHAGLVLTEPLNVAGVFRNRAYNIVEAQHSANTHPLGFQWYSHAYELNAASSNVSQM